MVASKADSAAVIREVLGVIDQHTHFLVSTRKRLRRQLAAAGLARARALLEGIGLLLEADRSDVAGVLGRALCEVWLVALYVLYKGKSLDDDSVLVDIAAAHAKWSLKIADRLDLTPEALDQVRGWRTLIAERKEVDASALKLADLNLAAIATELGPLLEGSGIGPGDPVVVYDRMYRFESIYGAHAGLGTFQHYLGYDPKEERDSIVERPDIGARPDVAGTALTMNLARHVYRAFGVQVSPGFAELEQRLIQRSQEASSSGA